MAGQLSYFVENIHQCQCFKYDNTAKHKPWLQHAFLPSHIILGASNSISFMVLFILDSVCVYRASLLVFIYTLTIVSPLFMFDIHILA